MSLASKLKQIKGLPWLLLLAVLGVVLFALSYAFPTEKAKDGGEGLEARLATTLGRIEGAGEVSVMLYIKGEDTIVGALIVAEGANDLTTCVDLTRAACTLLHIPADAVEVFPMRKGG